MTASGQSRHFERALATSAIHPVADISLRRDIGRFGADSVEKVGVLSRPNFLAP
jgi:hypothetical protein